MGNDAFSRTNFVAARALESDTTQSRNKRAIEMGLVCVQAS